MLLCLQDFIMAKHFCPLPGALRPRDVLQFGWGKQGELRPPCSHPFPGHRRWRNQGELSAVSFSVNSGSSLC